MTLEQSIADRVVAGSMAGEPPPVAASDTRTVGRASLPLRARTLFEEQIRQLYGSRIMIAAHAVNAVLISAIAYGSVPSRTLILWLVMMAVICTIRLGLHVAYQNSTSKFRRAAAWAHAYVVSTMLTGFAWAFIVFHLLQSSSSGLQPLHAVVAITIAGLSAGSLATAALYLPAFFAFVMPTNLMLVAVLLWDPGNEHLAIAVMIIFFLVFLVRFSQNWNVAYLDSLERKLNAEALVAQLQVADGKDRMILEAVDQGIFGVDLDDRVTFINPAGASMFGFEIRDLLGQPIHDVVHYKHADGSPYPAADCPIDQTLKDGKPRQVTGEVMWRGGDIPIPVDYRVTPLMNDARLVGAVVTVSDVTERERAATTLRENEEHLRRLTNGLPVLIASFDEDGRFLFANRLCCEWCSAPIERIVGRTADAILGADFSALTDEAIAQTRTGELFSAEATIPFPDGVERAVEFTCVPNLDDSGDIESIYILGADISHLNEIERQARELARQAHLRRLREDYSSAARLSLLDHFSSIVAHELNQPLTAIANYLAVSRKMLTASPADDRAALTDLFDKAAVQADRAGAIIQGLRELARTGRVDFAPESINDIITETCELTLTDTGGERVELRLSLADDLPPVPVSRVQMQQVFGNLLRNSVEAMAHTAQPIFHVATSLTQGGGVRIVVEDNGPGLSPDMRAKWMAPFVSTKKTGLGIGLSVCRSIIDAHGGSMEIGDGQLGGLCFCIDLPVDRSDKLAGAN